MLALRIFTILVIDPLNSYRFGAILLYGRTIAPRRTVGVIAD